MADTISKIKVNELETAAPKLTDTLLASGDVKEYACKIEDLKEVIGGGGGGGDWNASEGESGYIANRTHWVETGDSITGTFTLTQENIEDGEAGIQNSPLAEDVINTLGGKTVLNVDIIINNQTYKANISTSNDEVYINSSDESFLLEFSENEGIYDSYFEFNSSIFAVGENTITIPDNTYHKLNLNYIEDTILWQRGSGLNSIKTYNNEASGEASHAEGLETNASGEGSHAEGYITTASGGDSHAEGYNTTASGTYSHAEGSNTTASEEASHAEGNATTASGAHSHAEGDGTIASGIYSHAEGIGTTASGVSSHAEGVSTIANHASQHIFGEYNIADPSNAESYNHGTYVEIVGNGASIYNKSNARTLDWSGNEWLAGSISADGGLILKSPDGSSFTVRVANDGTLSATKNT